MTNTAELKSLIEKVEAKGATVTVSGIYETIQVSGLKGCGPFPMSPIAAAERLRELVAA